MSFGGINRVRLWALAGVSAVAIVSPAWAQDAVKDFSIPAQDMTTALETFGQQSDTDIIFDRAKVSGRKSAAISGRLTPLVALTRLTEGSGLSVRRVNATSFIVEPVSSQTPGAISSTDETVEVVVTGSHIRNANPTSPVHVLTRKDIDESGYSQIGDVMRALPQNFSGGQNPGVLSSGGNTQNQNITNASTVNLRGLGTDATLVLVNGHRVSADAFFQGSDISGIPFAAIQRVEVVSDGASALYGSDAVAGVVNIILRRNYDGSQVTARLSDTTQGGGQEQMYSFLKGVASERGHALFNLEYSKSTAIVAGDRDFTTGAIPTNTLVRPNERRSVYISTGRKITDHIDLSLDGLVYDRSASGNMQYTPTGPSYKSDVYVSAYSLAPKIEFSLPGQWKLNFTGLTSGSRDRSLQTTTSNTSTTRSLVYYKNNVDYLEFTFDGPLFNMPSGEVKIAFGGGYRVETFDLRSATSTTRTKGDRDVKYGYAEALIPLIAKSTRLGLRELELSVSSRSESYSDFGTTSNPKIGLRYEPIKGLSVRASWGKSFKTPSILQMNQPYDAYLYPASLLGYAGSGQTLYLANGSTDLKPERSKSWTFGTDFQPPSMESLKFSATYFNIDFLDRVVRPISVNTTSYSNPIYFPFVQFDPTTSMQSEVISGANLFYNTRNLVYDPSSVVGIVDNRLRNATSQQVSGIDLSYKQAFHFGTNTVFAFANATKLDIRQQTIQTLPATQLSGNIYNPPEWKARGGFSWQISDVSTTITANYISGLSDTGVTPNTPISSWTTIDGNISYSAPSSVGVMEGVKISLSATNLFDIDPPYARSPASGFTGLYVDTLNHSIVGRKISLSLAKVW